VTAKVELRLAQALDRWKEGLFHGWQTTAVAEQMQAQMLFNAD